MRFGHAANAYRTDTPTGEAVQTPQSDRSQSSDLTDKALDLANTIVIPTWDAVSKYIEENCGNPNQVKQQLASHTWCDLFIALAIVIEEAQSTIARIPDSLKARVKLLLLSSSMQRTRPAITAKIIDVLVDKAWDAMKGYAATHLPIARLITGDETLQTLRILAYLSCPNPDRHRDVREHALRPLEKQVQDMLTTETKERLRKAFLDWHGDDAFGETA